LGTVVTAQTMPGEDAERTERAPEVELEAASELELEAASELELEAAPELELEAAPVLELEAAPELELHAAPELELEAAPELELEAAPELELEAAPVLEAEEEEAELDVPIHVELPESELAGEAQPLVDPSPSCMPDVVMAMVALHTGVEADEAPTRLRDVITELRPPALTPEPELVEDSWLTHSSLEGLATAPKPALVELVELVELADPSVHEALTWNPGAVAEAEGEAVAVAEAEPEAAAEGVPEPEPEPEPEIELAVLLPDRTPEPMPATLLIAESAPEPSPYAPAVLPARASDVSELVDSFHVSSAAEERELRGALKEIAGLDLTPMPRPYAEAE
jgi:hypothetical protein